MKRVLWILLLMGSAATTMAQIASYNFTQASVTVTGWTNCVGDPSLAVRTATVNGVTVSSVSTSNWVQLGGASASNNYGETNGTYFPAAVMVNDWISYNGSSYNLDLYNALVPQLELTGLNPDSTYTLRMSASGIYRPSTTIYTVTGAIVNNSQSLNAYFNVSQGITFRQIQPDATGMIKIYVNSAGAPSQIACISGLQVFSGSTNVGGPVISLTTPANGTELAEGGNITITATASEIGGVIAKVQFYADTTKIGQLTAAPYTMSWVNPNPGSYTISAIATDTSGTINTATANIAIDPLNDFWSTTGNIATNGNTYFLGTVDTNRLAFRTNNVERMTILNDGTVGIGTKTTYGYALAVNGTAIFTKAKVKSAGTWPDYVFKPDYALPDLKDLERYLKEHQHLPGIAPERTVQQEGIDIAEQEAALLKKVEELTLYLIEQNKKLEAQQKEIDELKARMKTKQ